MTEHETPSQAAEAAAIRRRWITLGELLAVVAVVISGLTLWNSYSERSTAEAERQAEKKEQAVGAQTLILRGTPADGGKRLDLSALDSGQAIQSQTIAFPTVLGVAPVETVEPRIEAGWLKKAAEEARKAADKNGKTKGDKRLPVLITTRFFSEGGSHSDVAIYDVGYKTDAGFLGGIDVKLLGLSHVARAQAKNGQAKLDKLWAARN